MKRKRFIFWLEWRQMNELEEIEELLPSLKSFTLQITAWRVMELGPTLLFPFILFVFTLISHSAAQSTRLLSLVKSKQSRWNESNGELLEWRPAAQRSGAHNPQQRKKKRAALSANTTTFLRLLRKEKLGWVVGLPRFRKGSLVRRCVHWFHAGRAPFTNQALFISLFPYFNQFHFTLSSRGNKQTLPFQSQLVSEWNGEVCCLLLSLSSLFELDWKWRKWVMPAALQQIKQRSKWKWS